METNGHEFGLEGSIEFPVSLFSTIYVLVKEYNITAFIFKPLHLYSVDSHVHRDGEKGGNFQPS